MTPDPTTPAPVDPDPETLTIADEVATLVNEALDASETFTTAAVKVPFSVARLGVEKLRAAADALETQIRKAAGRAGG